MTAQYCLDNFIYNDEKYELYEIEGGSLLKPQDYGMNPKIMFNSGCWRGFDSIYKIDSEGLFLTKMTIHSEVEEGYKLIEEIHPKQNNYNGSVTYEGLILLTHFTGKLKLGRVHGGSMNENFQMTYDLKFIEFIFEVGKLLSIKDLGIHTLVGEEYEHRNGWS